jgi:N6-L-threonylcarbamoyladenine synthase
MRVLGIESSCDETGVAIYSKTQGLIANVLHSQIAAHQPYGGVVPELASRDHIRKVIPLLNQALAQANLKIQDIDAIAYTAGPGLIGALLVGACFAKSLALANGIPALAIHHLEAHILAAQMENPKIKFPFLALLVSGGHSQLIWAKGLGDYLLLGETIDDAAGEAFDKTAKMMGLAYPGGKALSELASERAYQTSGLKPFPRPLAQSQDFNFSFSGLKTHALYAWEKSKQDEAAKAAIAYAFQEAVVDSLLIKCAKAVKQYGAKQVILAGGVAANQNLRRQIYTRLPQDCEIFFPSLPFCTDNGAMIAYTGLQYYQQGFQDPDQRILVKARWPLTKT